MGSLEVGLGEIPKTSLGHVWVMINGRMPGVGMKVIQRLGLLALVYGLTGAGTFLLPNTVFPVQAQEAPAEGTGSGFSRAEVAERLNIVPVFTVVSQDGTPILANVDREGTTLQVASFWLGQDQANEAISQIQTANPEIAAEAQVIPVSLGYAYEVAEQQRQQNENLVFQVLPRPSDVDSALQIVKANGQTDIEEFPGVPLFYGVSDQGILTIERDGVEVVPFFFTHQDLQLTLDRAAGENAEVTQATKIEVTTLEQVVDSMLDSSSAADIEKIAFVPSRDSLKYVQDLNPDLFQLPPDGAEPITVPDAGQ
jgi:hypothetical protein